MTQQKAAAPGVGAAAKLSYTELFEELLKVLRAVTHNTGITKDEHLHATPRLGLVTTVANQSVALTFNARPKIKAVALKITTHDVGSSDTVGELLSLAWGKLPSANKK
jgi:hypothetical protein